MRVIYDIFIWLYFVGIQIAALWNKKAKEWINGRKTVFEQLGQKIKSDDRTIWIHCSSAGEFEQGKPIIEVLKMEYPSYKILVSFFSPSGYAVAKRYAYADTITYLPLDTAKNAAAFLDIVKPELVIFVKYDYWYHILKAIRSNKTPLLLASAVFRDNQIFFKWYGGFFKKMLSFFTQLFVQDGTSKRVLQQNGLSHFTISGDTRFDRVAEIATAMSALPFVQKFISDGLVIVAGSTWSGDENLLAQFIKENQHVKLIIAPHEVTDSHITNLKELFAPACLYSELPEEINLSNNQVLIIDSVGLLSQLYQYATIAYVGGGFTKDGIHNILEAAVWAKPVVFGPNYKKYREAGELIAAKGGWSITSNQELKKLADDLFNNKNQLQASGSAAKNYIENNIGATKKIMDYIQEKRLLTKL